MHRFVRRVAAKTSSAANPQSAAAKAAAAGAHQPCASAAGIGDDAASSGAAAPAPTASVSQPRAAATAITSKPRAAATDERNEESDCDAASVDTEPVDDEEFLQDLAEDQPEAVQWVAEPPVQAGPETSRKTYLHDRARRLLGRLSRMTTKAKQRKWAGMFSLTSYAKENPVAVVAKRLRQKASAVLRKLHQAALEELPDVDEEIRSLAFMSEEKPRAKALLHEGLRLFDPTRTEKNMFEIQEHLQGRQTSNQMQLKSRKTAKRDEVLKMWRDKTSQLGLFVAARNAILSAPQPEGGCDAETMNPAAIAAGPPAAPAADTLETMSPMPVGDIAYATSEWFWVERGPAKPWKYSQAIMTCVSQWEGVNCSSKLAPAEWRARAVAKRQQRSLPEAISGQAMTVQQHIATAAEELRRIIAVMTRQKMVAFVQALCLGWHPHTMRMADASAKFQAATKDLEREATEARLNLEEYPFRSRITVLVYWCIQHRQHERTQALIAKYLTPKDEDETCEAEDILIEAENTSKKTYRLKRRLKKLKAYIDEAWLQPYRPRLEAVLQKSTERKYVPGAEIRGTDLHEFSEEPRLTAPLHCMLCGRGFVSDQRLIQHIEDFHCPHAEYRKRVLFKYEERGPQPVTPCEKRNIVQNFSHFQQYSHPGAGSLVFSGKPPVPRSEAACAICARLDWKENRKKLNLFADPPAQAHDSDSDSDEDEEDHGNKRTKKPSICWYEDIAYLKNPTKVQEFLNVERYIERWPLIPPEELHASSIQHPDHPSWRWLLHTRRVPVLASSGAAQRAAGAETRPPCAGIGDPSMPIWSCAECLGDLCGQHPRLPLYAFPNDNWIGREKMLVRNTTEATRWLSSLGRFCWKQVRLGRGPQSKGAAQPGEDNRQTGVTGNTIFFAQPTAQVLR